MSLWTNTTSGSSGISGELTLDTAPYKGLYRIQIDSLVDSLIAVNSQTSIPPFDMAALAGPVNSYKTLER